MAEENACIYRVTAETTFWGGKARRKITDHSITSSVINGDPAYQVQILSMYVSCYGTRKTTTQLVRALYQSHKGLAARQGSP